MAEPAARLEFDGRFPFANPYGDAPINACRLRVWRLAGMKRRVMLASELADNPGASITNGAELLWAHAWTRYQPDYFGLPLCFEHYPAELRGDLGESIDSVDFAGEVKPVGLLPPALSGPRWQAFDPAAFNRLVGQEIMQTPYLREEVMPD
jgi:hypothetical protein